MQCDYFSSGACRSCTLMGTPYDAQLADKERAVRALLDPVAPDAAWLAPFANQESGFRNKAKLAVGGTVQAPTIGILDGSGQGVDLRDCGLYEPGLTAIFPALVRFITQASLTPYDLATRRGELKNLLVTHSPDGEIMLRFVLRSQESIARIRKHLGSLLSDHPQIVMVSANILPEHKAVLEGELEIALTEQQSLPMRVNGITLHLRARSFFQTSTPVAAALYRQAADWATTAAPVNAWDLYCGVGGFALHLADAGISATGVETSTDAIASARASAQQSGLDAEFFDGDAAAYAARGQAPELVVVNPPRRGIGSLADWLEASSASTIIYSSCNATSLARDLARMPSFRATHARLFDMFPQTTHHEVMLLLSR